MNRFSSSFFTGDLSSYEAQAAALEDTRPHPTEDALVQFGEAVVNEGLDLLLGTGLEDFSPIIVETIIGGFHAAAQRIERDADKARDQLASLTRDFDGSEVTDTEIQELTRKARMADVAVMAVEFIRDAASATYTTATGEVWTAWRSNVKASRTTAAQIEAKDALRAARARKHGATDPGQSIVAFRGSPKADTGVDAARIFDALNWAHAQWPDMALATTGAKGAEKIAIRWAAQKNVTLVKAQPDFERHGKAAPFRANDQMIELDPVCCITLAQSLDGGRGEATQPFGPALNLGQKADERGIRHIAVRLPKIA
ncbi:MAG TPA: DUF2493 domain-containing protein [Caulobacteraceae bacterium]|nr:DUF2493 domain-containing protein [Caulobacteraceae bacterium]